MTDANLGDLDGMAEIEKLVAILEFYFPGKSDAVRILLGAVASLSVINSRKSIPLWLCSDPGTSKSTVIKLVGDGLNLYDWSNRGIEYCLYIENLSPKAFRSVKRTEDDLDLLDRLGGDGHRVLITTELNLLWTKPQQQLDELAGFITKICDDDPSINYASAGRISSDSRNSTDNNFIWLAATIALPHKISRRFSNSLGPRLYFFKIEEEVETPAEMSARLTNMESSNTREYFEACMICIQAIAAFLRAVTITPSSIEWNKDGDEGTTVLSDAATILRVLRAGLTERKKKGKISFKATLEAPARARKIITQLARGQAVLRQSNSIGLVDVPIVCKTIFDTAEVSYPERTQIFYKLLKNNGNITLQQLANELGSTVEFVLETVEQLKFLGLVQLYGNVLRFTDEYRLLALGLRPYLFREIINPTEVEQ